MMRTKEEYMAYYSHLGFVKVESLVIYVNGSAKLFETSKDGYSTVFFKQENQTIRYVVIMGGVVSSHRYCGDYDAKLSGNEYKN